MIRATGRSGPKADLDVINRNSRTAWESLSSRLRPKTLPTSSKHSLPWPARSRSGWAPQQLTTSPLYRSDKGKAFNRVQQVAAARGACEWGFGDRLHHDQDDSVDLLGERPAYTLYFTSPAVFSLR